MVSPGLDFFDLVMVRSRGGLPRTPSRPLTISAIGATSEPQNKCAYGTAFPGPMAEQGANLDFRCPTKNTALHYACELGNLEIISHLVDKDCGLDLQNETKCTPLMVAVRKGRK